MTKDVISLSISVLLLFRHYISHKITFGAPSSGGVLCSACGAFISGSYCTCISLELFDVLPVQENRVQCEAPPLEEARCCQTS